MSRFSFLAAAGGVALAVSFAAPIAQAAPLGASCHTADSSQICIGLKYVVYKDVAGTPVVSEPETLANLQAINDLWKQCGISYQIDDYVVANPQEASLKFATANNGELDQIRAAYANDSTLLVATTGSWDRTGSLGNTGANAWTAMPGSGPYGAVLEKDVGTDANIIAHEIGHYLDLDHADNKSELMNPIIYKSSTTLTEAECQTARATAQTVWPKMLR